MIGLEYFQKIFDSESKLLILDIGAHYGDSVNEFITLFPKSHVFAFEPDKKNFTQLSARFKNTPNVTLADLAVSDKIGVGEFYRNNYSATNSLLPFNPVEINRWADSNDFHQEELLHVNQVTIDSYCGDQGIEKINILKLDIQGGELMALKGAGEILSRQGIDCIFCEVEFRSLYKNQPLIWDISAYLMERQYHFLNIVSPKVSEFGVLAWADAIYVNNNLWQTLAERHSAGKIIS